MIDLKNYVNKLLNDIGCEKDDPERPAMAADLLPMVEEDMHTALLDQLDESQREVALDMLEAGKDAAFMKFCQERIAGYNAIIQLALKQFADEYIAMFEEEE